ncbi:MAG: PASTA domain-containing protein [candidate division WOR-3 bacterium]
MKKNRKSLKALLGFLIIIIITLGIFLLINLIMPILVKKGRETTVPNLVGMNKEEAIIALERVGLRLGELRSVPHPEIPANRVVAQNPRAGRKVKLGRKVDLDISTGTGKVRIPNLEGLPLASAITTLERLGLNIVRIDSIRSPMVPVGRVVGTLPPSGSEVGQGAEVIVSVSTKAGTFPMPNLVGLNIETARGIIIAHGLRPGQFKSALSGEPVGTVLFQYPEEGMTVAPGDTVSLIIASPDTTRPR